MENSDALFWIQLKNRNRKSFTVFFNTMYPKLLSIAYKSVSKKDTCSNIIQETFTSFWNKIETINPEKRYMESYLIRILKNKITDYYRNNNSNIISLEEIGVEVETYAEEFDFDSDTKILNKIEIAIEKLPLKIKNVFILSKFKGYTYREIAQEKNISIKTVEAHVSKALKVLRAELKSYNNMSEEL